MVFQVFYAATGVPHIGGFADSPQPTARFSQIQESKGMKNFALLSIVGLALLQPAVEAIYLGPFSFGDRFFLGSIFSQRRPGSQRNR